MAEFLNEEYESRAELEVQWRPRQKRDEFRIQYNESDTEWSCGWHQDDDHEELGPTHFQVNHSEWDEGYYETVSFEDTNPMAVLEDCLRELKNKVIDLPEKLDILPRVNAGESHVGILGFSDHLFFWLYSSRSIEQID